MKYVLHKLIIWSIDIAKILQGLYIFKKSYFGDKIPIWRWFLIKKIIIEKIIYRKMEKNIELKKRNN